MPPKKKNTRAAQLHPQPMPSDYDTDTAANITDAPQQPLAPPPARTNTQLNLLVLRRYVPETERIISIAAFAVVYTFSPDTQQWEKSGVEGTLFVCQLAASPHPRYNVVILNRKGLENFITDLVSEEDIEITKEYVILQVLDDEGVPTIYGLWIFSDEADGVHSTREIVANAMQECAMRAAHANLTVNDALPEYEGAVSYDGPADEPQEMATPVQPTAGQQIDLLSLFHKPTATDHDRVLGGGNTTAQPMSNTPPMQAHGHFPSTADTDFFRKATNPGDAPPQPSQPPQQNALLDLFKSAKRG